FESLFVYLNDPVVVFDRYGAMININRMARKLFRLSKEEISTAPERFTLPKMIRMCSLSPEAVTKQLVESKDSVFHDVVINNKVCDMKFTEFSYTKDKSNKGVMCVIHDNTERLALEKSRKEFVSDVSHELRTPLTAIKGFVETVVLHPELDSEIKDQFMNDVIFECDRMTRIVEDLLVLSRLDNNRTAWKIETFDFYQFLEHLSNIMSVEAEKHHHDLECVAEKNLENMTGDREKLQQVLVNIVSNSIKYTPDGGKIRIVAKKAENGVVVCVEDNGMGIPQEDIPRLFERFYRVEKARTTDSGGSGLGLAITKEIIDSHGGKVWVESEVDVGTKMYVYMPYTSKLAMDQTMTSL
ncbi:MAG: cell wall metabolism sensor histidine kinase WalK, partial [Clostridia bacterium]|nr:cell wall metabolism sensor histidine kinase WalK [Clostridia bacterium]